MNEIKRLEELINKREQLYADELDRRRRMFSYARRGHSDGLYSHFKNRECSSAAAAGTV
jgi:hypothetical protein